MCDDLGFDFRSGASVIGCGIRLPPILAPWSSDSTQAVSHDYGLPSPIDSAFLAAPPCFT